MRYRTSFTNKGCVAIIWMLNIFIDLIDDNAESNDKYIKNLISNKYLLTWCTKNNKII